LGLQPSPHIVASSTVEKSQFSSLITAIEYEKSAVAICDLPLIDQCQVGDYTLVTFTSKQFLRFVVFSLNELSHLFESEQHFHFVFPRSELSSIKLSQVLYGIQRIVLSHSDKFVNGMAKLGP
jgi:hypothetical protein